MAAEVGLFLKALDEIPVAAGVQSPVEVAGIVAGRVLPVLAELDGKAVVRTAMQAGEKALYDDLRAKLKTADAHERRRVDEGRGCPGRGFHGLTRRVWRVAIPTT